MTVRLARRALITLALVILVVLPLVSGNLYYQNLRPVGRLWRPRHPARRRPACRAGRYHLHRRAQRGGKSTVLKTVSGILRPRSGSVVIGGVDLTGRPPEAILREGVACVPQRNGLFARLTVRQNVLMGAYVIRRRRKHIEARYQQLTQMFPLLAERPDVAAGALSGGQRRIVEFARALMLEPKVVLLDEPTLGLDPRSLAIISGSIVAMNRAGATVLMVEQNVRFGLSLAQHATVMRAGTVALTGPAEEIANHPNLMDVFFGAAKPHTRTHGEQQGH